MLETFSVEPQRHELIAGVQSREVTIVARIPHLRILFALQRTVTSRTQNITLYVYHNLCKPSLLTTNCLLLLAKTSLQFCLSYLLNVLQVGPKIWHNF